ncbi:MAG: hypothetical protein IJ089_07365 [Clostridia bacterium]|nr:hypothetical protein [Clostridia bacterium]MBQ8963600.1 hypothetical protein [Clostridia bacterium]
MDVKGKIEQLKQLRYLKGEVILLTQRLERLETEITGNTRCRWRGRATLEYGAQLVALRDALAARRATCMAQLGALHRYIDSIDDSRMRQIMAGRYVDGLSWKEVAARIGERDEQYPRRLHNRFLLQSTLPASLSTERESLSDAKDPDRRNRIG